MNIYQPYDVVTDDTDMLHLKLSEKRDTSIFLYRRALPVLILMITWFLLQQIGRSIPMGWIYLSVIIAVCLAALLGLPAYTAEIKIVRMQYVLILRKTISGKKEVKVNMENIAAIKSVQKGNNAPGATFMLRLETGKILPFVSITAGKTDMHSLELVKERFSAISGKPVLSS